MRKRLLAMVVVALSALAVAGLAYGAGTAKKHKVADKVQMRILSGGAKAVIYTGTIKDKSQGAGALVASVIPAKTAGDFTFTATAFFKNATVTVSGTNKAVTDADNNATYTGSGKATSGTGLMKGVKGAVKLNGTSPGSDPTYATLTLTGSFTY